MLCGFGGSGSSELAMMLPVERRGSVCWTVRLASWYNTFVVSPSDPCPYCAALFFKQCLENI